MPRRWVVGLILTCTLLNGAGFLWDIFEPVPLYDETAYYNAIKDKWVGLGDYATDQPGR